MAFELPYLYPYSRSDACERDEMTLWRDSHKANIACCVAIEKAITRDFDGMRLDESCAQRVIAEYGYKRVNLVLANTIRQKDGDGRFSQTNLGWAKQTYIPQDKDGRDNYEFVVESHPAVLDIFANQYRAAVAALGLFGHEQCEADYGATELEGKVLVLSPRILKEECWRPEDQL